MMYGPAGEWEQSESGALKLWTANCRLRGQMLFGRACAAVTGFRGTRY